MAMDYCVPSCSFADTQFLGNTCGSNYTVFMSLISYILSAQQNISDPCNRLGIEGTDLNDSEEYDFIVIGAGAAGPVVATRLSEVTDWKVLLLEAGPEEPTLTEIPAFAVSAVGTELDWQYKTEKQENACLSTDGVCNWPRGKMVSGTTGMQGMMYTRGHYSVYNDWEKGGNDGWGYDSLLPYFIKAENNKDLNGTESGYHGYEGPLPVQQFPYHPPLAEAVVEAGIELGYQNRDVTGKNQTGVAIALMMASNGLRATTSRVYLRPNKQRQNLKLGINSHVTRVLINETTNKATGVEFIDKNGNTKIVFANKEVIVSAGAIGSPQILLLSGIGPKKDLTSLGIPVKQDLPVGENLHNHISVSVGFLINDTSYATLTTEALKEFMENRNGPMSGTGLTQTTAFLLSKYAKDGIPDIQVFFDGFNAACSKTGLSEECTDGTLGECGKRYINARPTNILPQSRGYLKLKSTDPLDYPLLEPNYLTVKRDIDILVEGIKSVINLTQTSALQRWGFELDTTPVNGCENYSFASDNYWECVVKTNTGAENHQGGTCEMGPSGVVDQQLRVYGITNLRVVDTSIFPYMVNSNPIATIIAVAEKASDLVKSTWQ